MQKAQNFDGPRQVVLIAGPTASGKSALAMKLADALPHPVIINADSMQVYRDLQIITARPDAADEARHRHLLYGFRDGSSGLSTALWCGMLRDSLADVAGCSLIVVGGTGLYFQTLLQGLSPVPDIPEAVRSAVRARMQEQGPQVLHAQLDGPMADRLSPSDSQRIARALEVLEATGKSLSYWQSLPPEGALFDADAVQKIVLAPPRNWLGARIHQRAQMMLGEGGLEEVRALLARGLCDSLPVMRAIGVSAIGAYLGGEMDHGETLDRLHVQTRRYAKRQETWLRGQMGDWARFDPAEGDAENLIKRLIDKEI